MRIISGTHKGRKLVTFNYDHIRPTSDLVKEAMFNTLPTNLEGSAFLDLFSGTGNVGLEALSRGCNPVVLCDANEKSIFIMKKNNALLGGQAQIVFADYKKALKQLSDKKIMFDIIFIDPPYDTTFGEQALEMIATLHLLKPDGILVFEHRKGKDVAIPSGYQLLQKRTYGIKTLLYLGVENHD